ncbi:OmpA family lipoprotein [Aeromonas simiae]|uniref:OmpA family lipoprotein n=1 Tax=Aeromonas simiae TaxID=218936 RepID=A0A5J6X1L2_9GAMM|nr:OmpA family lipoprotein [Aeromonas simiae]MDO2948976.1 OmpA family lipoprotein [Aeromonas simiae]MDO2952463.1 OmpA family lipoprotein [Aeromonas simiae]MDO2956788.1 OmpA family lipoprotein [Aeromonas simiae]QFI56287.1 OmpA family lipoprotein [Aeromonas simiae]
MNFKTLVPALALTIAVSGCTTNPYTGEQQTSKAVWGSMAGAATGAAVGALSSSKGDRKKGILTGVAAGAALGGGIGYYMDVQEAKLREKLQGTGVSVTRNGDQVILNMPNSITFDSSSAQLKPAGANTLSGVATVVAEFDKTRLNVIGHTDSTGTRELNMKLSKQRADAVANQLIASGVAGSRIVTAGVGPDQPVASNSTEAGKAQNRRVTITLTPLQ